MTEHLLRVLIVDDEESIRKPLADRLHSLYNYQVDTAADGNKALHLIGEAQGRYDVTVIDQILEGDISGPDLLRNIKERYPEIQVIVFTGWGLKGDEGIRILRQGAYRYIAKGNYDELALTIRFAAEQRQLRREREYLSALVQVSHQLTQTTDLKRQLDLVWNFVHERLATATFFIALYDSITDTLRFPLSFDEGEPDPLADRRLGNETVNWGLAGLVVKNKRELTWHSREQAEREWQSLGLMPYISGKGPSETGICLPLQVGEKILGALSVQSYQTQAFDQAFLNAVRTLGSHLAPAIENARLFQEITQRTNEVETTRDHLDRLVSSSFDGIITIDTRGIVSGLNAMAENILGCRAKDVLGKSVCDLYYDPEEPRKIGKLLLQSADGKLADYETGLKSKSGDKIPIRLSATWLFDAEGKRIGSAGYFRDMREIQETELHRQQLLEASNAVAQAERLDQGLQSLARIMVESCISTFCSILLLASDDQSLKVEAAYPYPRSERLVWEPGIGKVCRPFQEPAAAEFMMNDEPIVLRMDKKKSRDVLKHLAAEIHLQGTLTSALLVPLKVDKKRLGLCVLGEMRKWDRSPIKNRKIELARSLAGQAAVFIEKMKVHELTQQRAELLEALQSLALTVSSSLDWGETLRKTCEAAAELFNVDHSGLVIFDPDFTQGRVAAEYPAELESVGIAFSLQDVPLEKRLIEQKEPIDVYDVINEEELGSARAFLYNQFNIHSVVFVPVVRKGKVLGSFGLDTIGHKRQFTPDEIKLCKIFAAHVASAVENANLYHQLVELNNVVLEISKQTDRDKLFKAIIEKAVQLLGAQGGGIYLVDETGKNYRLVSSVGLSPDLEDKVFGAKEGLTGFILDSRECQKVDIYHLWPRRLDVLDKYKLTAVAGAPIWFEDKINGTIVVHDKHEGRSFDDNDIELLEKFANHAALALNKSNLLNQVEKARNNAQVIAERIVLGDLQTTLDAIVEVTRVVVGCHVVTLYTYDEEQDIFGFPPSMVGVGHPNEALKSNFVAKDSAPYKIIALDDLYATENTIEDPLLGTPFAERERIKSSAGIPLIASGHKVGVMFVNYRVAHQFTNEELTNIKLFAYQAAIAIRYALLVDEAERRARNLETLQSLALTVSSSLDLDAILSKTCQAAVELFGVDHSGLILYNFDLTQGEVVAEYPALTNIIGTFIPVKGVPLQEQLIDEGEPLAVYDVPKETGLGPSRETMYNQLGINSTLLVPVVGKGKPLGSFGLDIKDQKRQFTKEETDLCKTFAAHVASAVDKARLFHEIEEARERLRSLYAASNLLVSAREPSRVLQDIVDQAREASRSTLVSLFIIDETGQPRDLVRSGSDSPFDIGRVMRPNGISIKVMKTGSPEVFDDINAKRDIINPIVFQEKIAAALCLPLSIQGKQMGVMWVHYDTPRNFSDSEIEALELYVNQAAIAYDSARRIKELQFMRQATNTLAKVTALGDLGGKLDSIVEETQKALACDVVTLYEYNEEREEFHFPPAMVGVKQHLEALMSGRVSKHSVVYKVLALEDLYAAKNSATDSMMNGSFVEREGIKSSVGIPLVVKDHKVGVMFVNYRSSHRFTSEEIENIRLFAYLTAVAIRNMQLYQRVQQYAEALEAIQVTSAAVSAVLDPDELLPIIADKAAEIFSAPASSLMLWDDGKEKLVIHAAFGLTDEYKEEQEIPRDKVDKIIERLGYGPHVFNISNDPIGKLDAIRKEQLCTALVTPYVINNELIGVLNIYSKHEPRLFNEKEMELATIFANHAAIAIKNAQLYEQATNSLEELKNTKGLVGARTALAWVGMASSAWRHTIEAHAITIREQVQLLGLELERSPKPDSLTERLNMIERLANHILDKPITSPLAAEEGVQSVLVNDIIRARMKQLWDHEPYKSVRLELDFTLQDSATTRGSPEWLRRALDMLIDNAVEATAGLAERKITLITRRNNEMCEISIIDNGRGIPDKIRDQLFIKPIEKAESEKGLGTGLLVAQTIVQTYGGDVRCDETDSTGTTMVVFLPLET
jgi:PAS domain S-box-containing protein